MTDKIKNTASLPTWQSLLLTALSALAAAFAALIGSGLFICVSGVLFAFLLCRGTAASWAAAPVAYALSFLFMGDPVFALTSLLFLVIAVPLAFCIKRRFSLSVTVAVLTLAVAATVAALFAATVAEVYGSVVEGFKLYIADMKAIFNEIFSPFRSLTDDAGYIIFTDQIIAELKQMFVMILPAFAVICCEALAYITAKMFLLLCIIFKDDALIFRPWRLRTATATSVVFALSYLVFILSSGTGVIFYSALNLMAILMPLTSISGFHAMFGEGSVFRNTPRQGTRIMLVTTCIVFLIISPVLLLATLSFWGAFDGVRNYFRNKKNDGGNDSF